MLYAWDPACYVKDGHSTEPAHNSVHSHHMLSYHSETIPVDSSIVTQSDNVHHKKCGEKVDLATFVPRVLANRIKTIWISEKFAGCIIPGERFIVFRLVHVGAMLKVLPYYDCRLINQNSSFSALPQEASFRRCTALHSNNYIRVVCQSMTGKVYVNSEYMTLNQDELVFRQVDKAKTMYVALRKQDLYYVQQKSAHFESKEVYVSNHLGQDCKSIMVLVEPAVVPTYSQQFNESNANAESSKQPTLKEKSKHGQISRHVCIRRKAHFRPGTKIGKAKKAEYVVKTTRSARTALVDYSSEIAQETHSGSSSLEFSRQFNVWSILGNLKLHTSRDVLYRPSEKIARSVPPPAFSQGYRSNDSLQQTASVQQNRQRFTGVRNSSTSVNHVTNSHSVATPSSKTRDVEDSLVGSAKDICVVRVPFNFEDVTQLLHASDYSKIIQQIGNLPHDLSPESLIPAQFIIGVSYFKLSKYKEAKEHFLKCQSVAKEACRDGDVMLCSAYLGDIEYASQSYLEATKYYKTAIRHYTSGSIAIMFKLTPPTFSAIHSKLASAFRNASMMVQAIDHYKTAINEAKTDRDRLSAHTSLGNLYQSMGDNNNALEEYKQSIQLAEKLSDHVSLGWAHGNIGNAYLGLNKKDKAVYHLQKSLDLAVEYERTPQAIGRTYNNLGTAYQSMNDLDKAEEYYDLALSQAIYGKDVAGQARVYGNIGNVHMLRKNYERAVPHYGEVLELSSDPSTVSTARHNRGCAYYEWATSLQPKSMSDQCKYTFHGSDCDVDVCLSNLSPKTKELYCKGCEDLKEVVKYHEERLQHIKGSSSGLTLSVSLFESNSRTFHRLQDCLFSLHRFEEALVVAEQSRARTLGELLLKRKRGQFTKSLSSPLSFGEIVRIIETLDCPVVYFSYTGARLICWIVPSQFGQRSLNTFGVPLADDQFDGKSFDYHLRYSLTEKLVERSFEMYQSIEYDLESSTEVQTLYKLIGKPIVIKLQQNSSSSLSFQQVTSVPDSYTSLLPLTCLFDLENNFFLGDHYYFNMAPSMLTMGIMNQFPSIVVELKGEHHDFCVVGDPNIPPFYLNGELWSLGRLPYARREAEWVAHVLQTIPMLGDQATKGALLIRLMNAKVVHIATHGSASAGFLAFATFAVSVQSGTNKHVDGSNVLLYPQDIEKLNFSPALVVLSSCDSGRGTVKADGIQGMARAFILAGAQSVLTTLWKVPDESASVFMQFFYQYLMDGVQTSLALQKAILSVRCFAKYSQYIHWSGYQLTGRDIQFSSKPSLSTTALQRRLGESSTFPRLSDIKKLEKALVNSPRLPTDVQVCCFFFLGDSKDVMFYTHISDFERTSRSQFT